MRWVHGLIDTLANGSRISGTAILRTVKGKLPALRRRRKRGRRMLLNAR